MSHSMTEAELKTFMARKEPPASDDWKPNHRRHKKPYGLILFQEAIHWRDGKRKLYEWQGWFATERARNDAIAAANKPKKWLPVVAMMKVDR
jgi:hypothetical protein